MNVGQARNIATWKPAGVAPGPQQEATLSGVAFYFLPRIELITQQRRE